MDIGGATLTGSALAELDLHELQKLTLRGAKIDEAFPALPACTRLETVSFCECTVNDAGLRHLKGLKGLRRLDLASTAATDAGCAELQAALPGLTIHR